MFSHFKRKKALKEQQIREEQHRREEEAEEEARQARLQRYHSKPDSWGRKPGMDKEWDWSKATSHRSHKSEGDEDDPDGTSPRTVSRHKDFVAEESRRPSSASDALEPLPDSPSAPSSRAVRRRRGRDDLTEVVEHVQPSSVEGTTCRTGKERKRSSTPSAVYEPSARRSSEHRRGRSAFKA